MAVPRQQGGGFLIAPPVRARRWLVVRSCGPQPEEASVLEALQRRVQREGIDLVEVLLGNASAEIERTPTRSGLPTSYWVLEDDVAGRGLHPHPGRPVRVLTTEELTTELMASERVISLP